MLQSDALAQIGKGIANHYRIDIMKVLEKSPNISLDELAEKTRIHYKTLAAHTARLHRSGLITKRYLNQSVLHCLAPRGHIVLKFLRNLE